MPLSDLFSQTNRVSLARSSLKLTMPLHLISGLFDCHRSRVPVFGIAAQIPSAEIGSGYFQETRPETLFKQCSHYCELVSGANQCVGHLVDHRAALASE
jgi:hypothetical protein